MVRKTRALAARALALALSSAACSNDRLPTPTASPLVRPDDVSAAMVSTQAFVVGDTATLTSLSGVAKEAKIKGWTVTWKISSTTVGSVSSTGFFKALSAGSARVIASAGGWADTIPVNVLAKTVANVSVSAPSTTMSVGQSMSLTATARDGAGNVITGLSVSWSSSNTNVATVTSSGSVTAITGGSATISATVSGIKGSVALTVSSSTTSSTTSTTYTSMTLPNAPILLNHTYPRVTGKSIVVRAGGDLQGALNSAARGDEIVLEAGARFVGNYTLPVKTGTAANGWVLIRSSASASLPPQGSRVGPTFAALMPKIVSNSSAPALRTAPGTSGWWISGVEITVTSTLSVINYGVVYLGEGGSKQSMLSQVPMDIVLDRTYVHGQPAVNTMRCVQLNSGRTQITDSYLFDCHAKGYDSQAILGWNGPGPYKIVNNMLAGAGENVMFGGATPSIAGMIPSDIEMRRNYVYTPTSWIGVWTKKNLIESKNVQRWLMEGNVFDGSWKDGQQGYAFVLKVSSNSSTGGGCTWCVGRDITIRNNIIRNAGAAFGLTGIGDPTMTVGERLNRVLIENNVVESINVGKFTGDGRIFNVMNNVSNLTIRGNNVTTSGSITTYLVFSSNPGATNFAFENNIASYGGYGFHTTWYGIGEASLQAVSGTKAFKRVVMIGAYKSGYPNGTFVSSYSSALATGAGANLATINSLTQNVAIP